MSQSAPVKKGLLHTGWRPAIGWACVLALLWHFVLFDLLLVLAGKTPAAPTGTDELVTVLLTLLGLGGLRTIEKVKGVSREGWPDGGGQNSD